MNKIPWQTLRTSYHHGDQIPLWLVQLTAPDPAIRQNAFEELSDEVIHQGSIVEATSYVVTFLIEMLSTPVEQGQDDILALLWQIALGSPEISEKQEKSMRPILEKYGRNFDQEVAQAIVDAERCQQEIRKGLPVYLRLLESQDVQGKIYLARLLSALPRDAREILDRLQSHIPVEPDPDTKAALLWAMGNLSESSPVLSPEEKLGFRDFFLPLITSEKDVLVRFSASVSQIIAARNDAAPEAVELLVDALSHLDRYPRLPWFDPVVWTAAEALANLQGEKRIVAFQKVIETSSDAKNVQDIVTILLNHLFIGKEAEFWRFGTSSHLAPDGTEVRDYLVSFPPPVIEKLTAEQSTILKMVLRNDRFWEIPNTYLLIYGLPATRDGLAHFLNEPE